MSDFLMKSNYRGFLHWKINFAVTCFNALQVYSVCYYRTHNDGTRRVPDDKRNVYAQQNIGIQYLIGPALCSSMQIRIDV